MTEEDTPMVVTSGEAPTTTTAEETKKERAPRAKEGKIIVRNLGFDLREKHLKAAFRKFGELVEVHVPTNQTNNNNRGFGFVEF